MLQGDRTPCPLTLHFVGLDAEILLVGEGQLFGGGGGGEGAGLDLDPIAHRLVVDAGQFTAEAGLDPGGEGFGGGAAGKGGKL